MLGGILKRYFDSEKFNSFRRQLNLYGFTRLQSPWKTPIFAHKAFKRENPENFHLIKREIQYNPSQKKNIDYECLERVRKKIGNELLYSKLPFEETIQDYELIKFVQSFRNIYGRNIKAFIQKLINDINNNHCNLSEKFSKEICELKNILNFELNGGREDVCINIKNTMKNKIAQLMVKLIDDIVCYFDKRYGKTFRMLGDHAFRFPRPTSSKRNQTNRNGIFVNLSNANDFHLSDIEDFSETIGVVSRIAPENFVSYSRRQSSH